MCEVEDTRPQWDPLRRPRPQGDEQGVQVVLVRLLVVLVRLLVVLVRLLVVLVRLFIVLVRLATGGTPLTGAGPPSRPT
jgi:hypothetical protein